MFWRLIIYMETINNHPICVDYFRSDPQAEVCVYLL